MKGKAWSNLTPDVSSLAKGRGWHGLVWFCNPAIGIEWQEKSLSGQEFVIDSSGSADTCN